MHRFLIRHPGAGQVVVKALYLTAGVLKDSSRWLHLNLFRLWSSLSNHRLLLHEVVECGSVLPELGLARLLVEQDLCVRHETFLVSRLLIGGADRSRVEFPSGLLSLLAHGSPSLARVAKSHGLNPLALKRGHWSEVLIPKCGLVSEVLVLLDLWQLRCRLLELGEVQIPVGKVVAARIVLDLRLSQNSQELLEVHLDPSSIWLDALVL